MECADRRWPGSVRLAVWLGVVVTIVVASAGMAVWWRTRPTQVVRIDSVALADSKEDAVLDEHVVSPPPGYLGPQACAACHADRVTNFQQTRHFQACVAPNAQTMPIGFTSGHQEYSGRRADVRFKMTREGDSFWQTANRESSTGEERTSSLISRIYGAGAGTDEVYFARRGDRLYELPVVWLHPTEEWGESSFIARYGAGSFACELSPRCLECHNTWMHYVPGSVNQYQREPAILSVTCEVCHGPGRDHVEFHQLHPETQVGERIVHPGKLLRERQMDLATEHLQAVIQFDPNDQYGESMLGWLAYLDGRFIESLDHYQRADEIEPFNDKINFHLGQVFEKLDRWQEAIERFQQVLVIDPKSVETCHHLSVALRRQGRATEAIPYALRAVQLSQSKNADDLLVLAETYAEVDRIADAIATAEQALNVAVKTNSRSAAKARQLLERWKSQGRASGTSANRK